MRISEQQQQDWLNEAAQLEREAERFEAEAAVKREDARRLRAMVAAARGLVRETVQDDDVIPLKQREAK